jgi:hypothetical protein
MRGTRDRMPSNCEEHVTRFHPTARNTSLNAIYLNKGGFTVRVDAVAGNIWLSLVPGLGGGARGGRVPRVGVGLAASHGAGSATHCPPRRGTRCSLREEGSCACR